VPNEALEENTEEVDIMSLLAEQGEPASDEIVDDDDSALPDTVEELKAALLKEREIKSKRNHSLRKSKQAQHRTQEENDKLLARLAKVEENQTRNQSGVEAERLEKISQEWKEKVEDDPTSALEYMDLKQSQLEEKLSSYLEGQFSSIADMFEKLEGATNPEKMKYAKEVEALRARDGFSNLDDDTLVSVAKALKESKVKAGRGTIGGKRKPKAEKRTPDFGGMTAEEVRKKMGFKPRKQS